MQWTFARMILTVVYTLCVASFAFAAVTVCQGDTCYEADGGELRTMSPSEAQKHWQTEMENRIFNVDCAYADDAAACERIKKQLIETFR